MALVADLGLRTTNSSLRLTTNSLYCFLSQMALMADLGRVFEIGPVFRSEKVR